MKLTNAVQVALEARIKAINEELRILREERSELQDALGSKTTTETSTAPRVKRGSNQDKVYSTLLEYPGLTPSALAPRSDIKTKSIYSALQGLVRTNRAYNNNGHWYPVDPPKRKEVKFHIPGH